MGLVPELATEVEDGRSVDSVLEDRFICVWFTEVLSAPLSDPDSRSYEKNALVWRACPHSLHAFLPPPTPFHLLLLPTHMDTPQSYDNRQWHVTHNHALFCINNCTLQRVWFWNANTGKEVANYFDNLTADRALERAVGAASRDTAISQEEEAHRQPLLVVWLWVTHSTSLLQQGYKCQMKRQFSVLTLLSSMFPSDLHGDTYHNSLESFSSSVCLSNEL